jgi:hypothetical protein
MKFYYSSRHKTKFGGDIVSLNNPIEASDIMTAVAIAEEECELNGDEFIEIRNFIMSADKKGRIIL